MIRRGVAGLILGVSLLVGSLAWTGFLALRTVFDPDRSSQVAEDLLDDEAVRDQLSVNLGRAVESALPDQSALSADEVERITADLLESPEVSEAVLGALGAAHGAFLGEGSAPRSVDLTPVAASARDTIVAALPSLDAELPAAPTLVVELPTERIPNAGPLRSLLQTVVPVLALVAGVGVLVALFTTTHRAGVLRRAGSWALGTTAFYLIVGLGLPWLLRRYAPEQAEVLAALIAAVLRSVVTPSLVLGGVGVALVGVSFLLDGRSERRRVPREEPRPVGSNLRSARPDPHPAGPSQPPEPSRSAEPSRRPVSSQPPGPSQPAVSSQPPGPSQPVLAAPVPTAVPPEAGAPSRASGGAPPPDEIEPREPLPWERDVPAVSDPPSAPAAPSAPPPHWVEGVGWVLEPGQVPPPDARWVAGAGYVLDHLDPPEGAAGPPRPERSS